MAGQAGRPHANPGAAQADGKNDGKFFEAAASDIRINSFDGSLMIEWE
jgi:hypothetical protein